MEDCAWLLTILLKSDRISTREREWDMGLDQYLYRREYVSGHSFNENDPAIYKSISEALNIEPAKASPHMYVDVCVAYWRKANAIHGYIVRNFAGGVDECQRIYLRREDLQALRDKCESVLCVPATAVEDAAAQNDLAPTPGFFFGNYAIDDWYMEDMRDTVEQIDRVLSDSPEYTDFYYQASW